jgi:hypothetical protein
MDSSSFFLHVGFMSSLDLHTHAAYQSTLKEAIAIVCAPTSEPKFVSLSIQSSWYSDFPLPCRFGIFRLTDPPGLDTVMNCRVKETFHPHPEHLAIYTVRVTHLSFLYPLSYPLRQLRIVTGRMCDWSLACIWRLSICVEDRTFLRARGLAGFDAGYTPLYICRSRQDKGSHRILIKSHRSGM